LRKAVEEVDPNMPALSVKTLQTEREGAFSSQQILGFLSSLFALLSLLLVGVGLYGVLAYALHRRTKELGIRMALGASLTDIARQFLAEAAGIVGLGLGLGVPAALGAVTLLQSQLFGVEPSDLRTLGACTACVLAAVAVALIGPLRGALRISPQQALRSE
jgi:ABC-type antimicrobial peptide transport system permease subunit